MEFITVFLLIAILYILVNRNPISKEEKAEINRIAEWDKHGFDEDPEQERQEKRLKEAGWRKIGHTTYQKGGHITVGRAKPLNSRWGK